MQAMLEKASDSGVGVVISLHSSFSLYGANNKTRSNYLLEDL